MNAFRSVILDFKPPKRRHAYLVKWETSDLALIRQIQAEYMASYLRQGGIGVVFGRTRQFPGGRYFVTLLLLSKAYSGMPDAR